MLYRCNVCPYKNVMYGMSIHTKIHLQIVSAFEYVRIISVFLTSDPFLWVLVFVSFRVFYSVVCSLFCWTVLVSQGLAIIGEPVQLQHHINGHLARNGLSGLFVCAKSSLDESQKVQSLLVSH